MVKSEHRAAVLPSHHVFPVRFLRLCIASLCALMSFLRLDSPTSLFQTVWPGRLPLALAGLANRAVTSPNVCVVRLARWPAQNVLQLCMTPAESGTRALISICKAVPSTALLQLQCLELESALCGFVGVRNFSKARNQPFGVSVENSNVLWRGGLGLKASAPADWARATHASCNANAA